MAATTHNVTSTPTAIAGLQDGQTHSIQLIGVGPIRIESAAAQPLATSRTANSLDSGGFIAVYKDAAEDVYVWDTGASPANASYLVINRLPDN